MAIDDHRKIKLFTPLLTKLVGGDVTMGLIAEVYIGGRSVYTAARIMGVPRSTAAVRIAKGVALLREIGVTELDESKRRRRNAPKPTGHFAVTLARQATDPTTQ